MQTIYKIKTIIKDYIFNLNKMISSDNLLVFILKMLLIVLLLFMNDNTILYILIPVLIIPGILINKITTNKYYWLIISVFSIIPYLILDLIGYVPNHKHIFAYAILATTLMLFYSKKEEILKNLGAQAKFIIGLCFLFAVIGKFLAPEFTNGAFFEFTNTADPRFFGFTSFMADIDMSLLLKNETNLYDLMNTTNPDNFFYLNGVEKLSNIGLTVSYWTIFIEGMIAISFCLPNNFLISKYRNVFLVTFILTTYPIATVSGFAIILTTLGFIQSIKDNKLTNYSLFYLLVYITLPLIKIPFLRVLDAIF
tara:strand:- start:53891 stop:54817 length:927 start_codon:yes stop_codon:yes gene_type:complete